MTGHAPILVRGLSRSGGTLMVTVLDAHPDIAMSYELYPTLLELDTTSGGEPVLRRIARDLARTKLRRVALNRMPTRGLRTFLARSERSGIDHRHFALLLEEHLDSGLSFETLDGRMRFMERCCLHKMRTQGKSRWGLKCNNRFDEYLRYWPNAYFLNMLRDGRDVLSSQLNTGSFNKSAGEVAKGWIQTHSRFQRLLERGDVNACFVKYENLTTNPVVEVARVCEFLKVRPVAEMLDFHRRPLTIYSTSHLSMNRISKPIDSSRIGRWRRDLTPEQLGDFTAIAGAMLSEFDYQMDADA